MARNAIVGKGKGKKAASSSGDTAIIPIISDEPRHFEAMRFILDEPRFFKALRLILDEPRCFKVLRLILDEPRCFEVRFNSLLSFGMIR
ncbi:uncharacterized protein A4U43_C08F20460 [Asparagus officinalis]|nr:uncharacterized protein A4U43_C08F20460 [Asparagus officinalis]